MIVVRMVQALSCRLFPHKSCIASKPMKNRSVKNLLHAEMIEMEGMSVRQPFPTLKMQQLDPFLLLHHADNILAPDIRPEHAGVGPHPHRGFSAVTFIFRGGVHHRDSRGNDSVVYAGGVQWMNAGMGLMHSERPPVNIQEIGGRQEIIQLWINTPAKYKMDQPEYFSLPEDRLPKFVTPDGRVSMSVIAGELMGKKGVVPTKSPVNAATMEIIKGSKIEIPIPLDHNAFLYVLSGEINIGGYGLTEALNAAIFANDGEGIGVEAREDARMLLMSGLPLNEKVVSHGPFVMNTETQILEAMRDYQKGKMGILIED